MIEWDMPMIEWERSLSIHLRMSNSPLNLPKRKDTTCRNKNTAVRHLTFTKSAHRLHLSIDLSIKKVKYFSACSFSLFLLKSLYFSIKDYHSCTLLS